MKRKFLTDVTFKIRKRNTTTDSSDDAGYDSGTSESDISLVGVTPTSMRPIAVNCTLVTDEPQYSDLFKRDLIQDIKNGARSPGFALPCLNNMLPTDGGVFEETFSKEPDDFLLSSEIFSAGATNLANFAIEEKESQDSILNSFTYEMPELPHNGHYFCEEIEPWDYGILQSPQHTAGASNYFTEPKDESKVTTSFNVDKTAPKKSEISLTEKDFDPKKVKAFLGTVHCTQLCFKIGGTSTKVTRPKKFELSRLVNECTNVTVRIKSLDETCVFKFCKQNMSTKRSIAKCNSIIHGLAIHSAAKKVEEAAKKTQASRKVANNYFTSLQRTDRKGAGEKLAVKFMEQKSIDRADSLEEIERKCTTKVVIFDEMGFLKYWSNSQFLDQANFFEDSVNFYLIRNFCGFCRIEN